MVKATRRSAVLLGLAALGLLASSIPAFAEVQNVKVGGDYTARAFWRRNLDLKDNNGSLDDQRFIQQTTGLNIGSDLTENVSSFIRLANETIYGSFGDTNLNNSVNVSQAYVKIKDLFFSPLTVTLGRQPIVWGRGFVLGSGLIPNVLNAGGAPNNTGLPAKEFTDFTAFDAIRGTLDFQGKAAIDLPLTVDMVYIKLNEHNVGINDDVNLMGVNVGAKFDAAQSEVETYFLNKRDLTPNGATIPSATLPVQSRPGSLNTIGIRGSAAPVEGSSIYGELGYQFGHRAVDVTGILKSGEDAQAWAFDLGAEYTAKDVPTTPKLGLEGIFFSGKDVDGAVTGWDPIARGYFTTALREFQSTGFYAPTQTCEAGGGFGNGCTGSATNQFQFSVYGSLKPLNDLTIAPRLSWFVADIGEIPTGGAAPSSVSKRKSFVGTELDTQVTYNYTDDVQFGVIYALFAPGNIYRAANNADAQELVTTVGVKF